MQMRVSAKEPYSHQTRAFRQEVSLETTNSVLILASEREWYSVGRADLRLLNSYLDDCSGIEQRQQSQPRAGAALGDC